MHIHVHLKYDRTYTCTSLSFSVCDNDDQFRYVDNIFSISRPGIGTNILYLVLEGFFFFILTLLIEVYTHLITFCAIRIGSH